MFAEEVGDGLVLLLYLHISHDRMIKDQPVKVLNTLESSRVSGTSSIQTNNGFSYITRKKTHGVYRDLRKCTLQMGYILAPANVYIHADGYMAKANEELDDDKYTRENIQRRRQRAEEQSQIEQQDLRYGDIRDRGIAFFDSAIISTNICSG